MGHFYQSQTIFLQSEPDKSSFSLSLKMFLYLLLSPKSFDGSHYEFLNLFLRVKVIFEIVLTGSEWPELPVLNYMY